MKEESKIKLKAIAIAIILFSLLIYAAYVHRDDPYWMRTVYVKIIK